MTLVPSNKNSIRQLNQKVLLIFFAVFFFLFSFKSLFEAFDKWQFNYVTQQASLEIIHNQYYDETIKGNMASVAWAIQANIDQMGIRHLILENHISNKTRELTSTQFETDQPGLVSSCRVASDTSFHSFKWLMCDEKEKNFSSLEVASNPILKIRWNDGESQLPMVAKVLAGNLALFSVVYFVLYKILNQLITKRVVEPINELAAMIQKTNVSKDNLIELQLPEGTAEEIKTLGRTAKQWMMKNDLLRDEVERNRLHKAVAHTTQMVVHDVRKPFSMIQGLLHIVSDASSVDECHDTIKKILPEVDRSLASVNSMLIDILEVGKRSVIKTEPTEIQDLILQSLRDVFSFRCHVDVDFEYSLQHVYMLDIDMAKMIRALSNILINAVQSMKGKGNIRFTTSSLNSKEIEIRIGNSNSFIPEEDRNNIFELFHTRRKNSGTGLGLVIVKKIIESHHGTIFCEVSEDGFVEFVVRMPASDALSLKGKRGLPARSQELKAVVKKPSIAQKIDKDTQNLDQETTHLVSALADSASGLRVLVVDDEVVYQSIFEKIHEDPQLEKSGVELHLCGDPLEALRLVDELEPDIVFMDIDLHNDSMDGFDVIRRIRGSGFPNKVYVHSNRVTFVNQEYSVESGADLFLPKPISKNLYLSLLLEVVEDSNEDEISA